MNKLKIVLPALLSLALPFVASAHEHDNFKIGNSYYQFVVGSLNEPLVVDDKSGLDLTITKCNTAACTATMGADGDMDGPAGTPVTGLESTLKVEMVAGDQKSSMDISPQYGKDGAYKTTFYPTVATTFSYHITGTLAETPVDLMFTCVPAGTAKAADDTTAKKLSDSVTQTLHGGAFGCALTKEDLGFPQKASSLASVSSAVDSTKGMTTAALAISILGVILGGVALMRKRS
jgi:hypothetical protein